ncbi:MAG: HD-GYP domain-containing protein [Tuberibacillus sp.]
MLLAAIITIFILYTKRSNRIKEKNERFHRLLTELHPESGLENNMNKMLEMISGMVPAMTYSFYIFDKKNQRFVLRSVRAWTDADAKIAPSYSGLLPYQGEHYHPPINLEIAAAGDDTSIVHQGEINMINIALGELGVIRVGPVNKVKKKVLTELSDFSKYLTNQTAWLINADYYKEQSNTLKFSEDAVQYILRVSMDPLYMIQNIFESSFFGFSLASGFFVQEDQNGFKLLFQKGMPSSFVSQYRKDRETLSFMDNTSHSRSISVTVKGDPKEAAIPALIKNPEHEAWIVYRCHYSGLNGVLFFGLAEDRNSKNTLSDQIDSMKVMLQKLDKYLKFQSGTNQVKQIQVEKLKMLAQIVDNKSPFTVGYSDMMSRFSIIIAKEMNLDNPTIANVGLAAYLSNIGVIGLSDSFLFKEGKYSELEYDQMKHHAEVGASIIESTVGNQEVASFIRYHHERMDGNGYPEGLIGDEIPIGARIIAVVQTFLAKINGRNYRDPVDFDQALEVMNSVKGTQLDEQVVDTFIQWFQKKRQNPLVVGKSLGRCWEMCCVPASICLNCPAYGQHEKNCWEFENNNCQAHGRSCETCFVYTEAKARMLSMDRIRSGEKSFGLYESQKR